MSGGKVSQPITTLSLRSAEIEALVKILLSTFEPTGSREF
jgi:hypothetical protein